MKRLTQILLTVTLPPLLTGCNTTSLVNYELNPNLPKLNSVTAVADTTTIGFEWKPLKGLDGVGVYRTEANQYVGSPTKQLTKITTILNPYATHFVDSGLQQNSTYTYTFTTIKDGYESDYGKVIEVKTKPPLPQVAFFQGVQKNTNVIKLIWRPHPDKRVKMYRIERSVNGGNWKWIGTVENRMMVEYIDNYVHSGMRHQYRIIAIGFDGSYSKSDKVVTINAR